MNFTIIRIFFTDVRLNITVLLHVPKSVLLHTYEIQETENQSYIFEFHCYIT